MFAYWGKILRVNLTDGTIKEEHFDEKFAKKWLGTRGFGIYYLLKEMDPTVDPFSPENKIIYATGPLTGTTAPTGGRYMVITKSPLTGYIAMANSGGFFGAELKFAGWDAIIVEGASDHPVYLYINDESVEIRDASHLWGKTSSETEKALREEIGDKKIRVALIGPAGENLVRFAAVMNDEHRAAGRGGVGAVMGSKKLKAIVVRGHKRVEVADRAKFTSVVKEKTDKLRNDPTAGGGLPKYGTAVLVNIITASTRRGTSSTASSSTRRSRAVRLWPPSTSSGTSPATPVQSAVEGSTGFQRSESRRDRSTRASGHSVPTSA